MRKAKLEVGNTLQAVRAEFLGHSRFILQVTLLFSILSGLSTLIRVADPFGFAIGTGFAILLGAIFGGLMTALICVNRDATRLGELWPVVKPVLARLIWLTLVLAAGIILGTFAFFVPGIFLAVFWSVAGPALLVEHRGVFESLGRSFDLVRGNGWQVLGVLVVLGLIGAILVLIMLLITQPLGTGTAALALGNGLSNFVTAPLVGVGTAVLYNHLVELNQPMVTETEAEADDAPGLPPEPRE